MRFITLVLSLSTLARAQLEPIPRPRPQHRLRAARQLTVAGAILTGIGATLAVGAIGAGASLASCSPGSFGNDCELLNGVATYTVAPLSLVFLAVGIPMLAVGAHRMNQPIPFDEPAPPPRAKKDDPGEYGWGRKLSLAGWAVTALSGAMFVVSMAMLDCRSCGSDSVVFLSGTVASTVIGLSMVIVGSSLKADAQRRYWLGPTATAHSGGLAAGMTF
jgi:hypothetical protein